MLTPNLVDEPTTVRITVSHKFNKTGDKIIGWDWHYEDVDITTIFAPLGSNSHPANFLMNSYRNIYRIIMDKVNELNNRRIETHKSKISATTTDPDLLRLLDIVW